MRQEIRLQIDEDVRRRTVAVFPAVSSSEQQEMRQENRLEVELRAPH